MNYPIDIAVKPEVAPFFDPETNTISYVVRDPSSPSCAVIDSVMDIDYAADRISYKSADLIIAYIRRNGLQLDWLIETHAHADHLSAAPYIQQQLGGRLGIGEHIVTVQETFGKIFNEGTEFKRDGSQFDRLFKDGDTYPIGNITAFVMHTPGHTPVARPTSSETRPSPATHCSCLTEVRRGQIFREATPAHSIAPFGSSLRHCRQKPDCFYATTMDLTVATFAGKRLSAKSACTTSMFAMV